MKVRARKSGRLHVLFATLLLPVAAACSDIAAASASQDRITLANRTSAPIVYYALTPESAARTFMAMRGRVAKPPLGPGATVTLTADSIEGEYRPGGAIVLYLYAVAGDSMVQRDMVAFTSADLERIGYHLDITDLPLRPARIPPG